MSYHSSRFIRYLRDNLIVLEVICTFVIVAVWVRCFHIFEEISLYNSLYYTIITIAGVGYGDITPVTDEGKFVAMSLAWLGMPLYLITATLIATRMVESMRKMKKNATKIIISKVKALIIEDEKIMFLKTKRDGYTIWDLPWWTIHYGEKAENALIRRVMQEISAQIQVEKSLGIWRWIDQKTGAFSLCHTYLSYINIRDKRLIKKYSLEKIDEIICWLPIQDIVSWKIDLENDSLTLLIKEQCWTLN